MSIIRYTEISLSALLEKSTLVLEVQWLRSYQEEVSVDADPEPSGTIPLFIKKGNVFLVKQVLKNEEKISVPESVQVPNENWRRFFSQHKAQYLNGPNKSYGVDQYKISVPSIEQAGILFLRHFNGHYEFAAANAFEQADVKDKVIALLQR